VTNALESLEKTAVKELFVKILHEDDRLFLEVRDTGRGMDQKEMNLIYENGYSTKGENRGLGLYITKRSLAHLNGTIYVLSEQGQGTTFYVSLPYRSKERFFD
jgi:CitB family two-component system sensor histidine kinase MalK